jgi:hypothetical protein
MFITICLLGRDVLPALLFLDRATAYATARERYSTHHMVYAFSMSSAFQYALFPLLHLGVAAPLARLGKTGMAMYNAS